MKVWRRNKTTIVITHDLSQITKEDFIYVVKGGRVVEQGYRSDLEVVGAEFDDIRGDVEGFEGYGIDEEFDGSGRGEFRKMMKDQQLMGGCLPARELDAPFSDNEDDEDDEGDYLSDDGDDGHDESTEKATTKTNKHQSLLRPLTLGNWMFDVVAELVGPSSYPNSHLPSQHPFHTNAGGPPPPLPPVAFGGSKRGSKRFSQQQSFPGSFYPAPSYYPQGPHRHVGHIPPRADLSPVPERRRRPSSVIVESPIHTSFGHVAHPYGYDYTKEEGSGGKGYAIHDAPSTLGYSSGYGNLGYGGAPGGANLGRSASGKQRLSLQFVPTTPSSATFTLPWNGRKSGADELDGADTGRRGYKLDEDEEDEAWKKEQEAFEREKEAVKKSAGAARIGRDGDGGEKRRRMAMRRQQQVQAKNKVDVVVVNGGDEKSGKLGRFLSKRLRRDKAEQQGVDGKDNDDEEEEEQPPKFFPLLREMYPTIPGKPLLFFGLIVCVASGAMTPIFSSLLSRLLYEVSIGAQNTRILNIFGGIVLAIAALDGILLGVKYFVMELCGVAWVTRLREIAFRNLLHQDLSFFETNGTKNSPARLVQVVVKDAEDSRNLVAVVIGQCLVVTTMLGVGLIWAMVRGWELTLVGLAVAPVFAVIMSVQTTLVGKCEVRNKRAREGLAKAYYDSIINIRGIRAMSFERHFEMEFEEGVGKALKTGVRGAFVEGCTYGVASGLIYLAEALLFYVGAVLISKQRYSYLQMVEVLNLVVFTVTIGSQLMAFSESFAFVVRPGLSTDVHPF